MATADVKRTASIYINDVDAQRALKRLQEEAKHLVKRLEEVPNGSKDFKDISNRLTQVQRNMKALAVESKEQDGWFTKMKGSLGGLGGMLAGVFAFDAIKSGFKATLDAHREHEMAVAKVETALKNQGATAGVTFQQMAVDANRLQENSLFSDEDILSKASTSLLNFGNIAGDNFMRAQQTAVDLSTTMDGDLQGAAMAVGKALNNPVQGLTALQRMGVRFTEDQKDVIKTLVDTGKASEAQGIILGELEKRFAGQAKAQAEAEGGYHRLSVAIDELAEGIGGGLSTAFNEIAGGLAHVINGAAEWLGLTTKQSDAVALQRVEMNSLFNVLREGNITEEQRADLVARINKEYGDFLPKSISLTDSETDLAAAQRATNTAMLQRIELLAKQELLQEAQQDAVDAQKDVLEMELTLEKARQGEVSTWDKIKTGTVTAGMATLVFERRLTLMKEASAEAQQKLDDLSKSLGDVTGAMGGGSDTGTGVGVAVEDPAEIDKKTEEVRKVLQEARQRMENDRLKGMDKELAEVADKYWKLAQQAEGSGVGLEEIEGQHAEERAAIRAKWAAKELEEVRKLDEQIAALRAEAAARNADDGGLAQDLAKVEEKYAKLEEAAKGHSSRLAALAELEQEELQAVRQKHAEQDQAAREEVLAAEEEERLAGIERKLTAMDEEYALEVAKREEQELGFEDLRIAHEERRNELEAELLQAKKDIVDQHFEELYAQADAQGISTENLQRLHGEAILSIEQEAAREQVRLTREKNATIVESEKARNAAVRETAVGMLDALDAVFTATAADAKEAQDFHKAITIVKIGVDTASAISGIIAASAIGDPFTAAIRIASGVAVVLTNIAKATALLNKDTPEPPKFAEGGSTGRALPSISQGGHIGKPMLGLFGEAGDEWVAPHKMYRHPVLAPVFHWLEDVRVSGRLPAYAMGGDTYDQVLPGVTTRPVTRGTALVNALGPNAGGNEPIGPMLGALATALSTLNGHLTNGIVARMNYDQQQEDNERMDTIKTSANRAR